LQGVIQEPLPSQSKKTGHKRTNNFTLIEDEKIYSA
jgi:hypothetical protein